MNLSISQSAKNKVDNAILISGSARSGTTIMGKVVHSMEGVEYSFEPPVLCTLIPLIKSLKKSEWKLLYETYLYEEFFINPICGRNINCNVSDNSSIYKVKADKDITSRLDRSISKNSAEKIGNDKIIAYKMPDITPFLSRMIDYYPDTRLILMRRGAIETINSILQKGWFSDSGLSTNMIWPFLTTESVHVPYWVNERDVDLWLSMDEINRCAYYYIRVNQLVPDNAIVVNYENLVSQPLKVVRDLANLLELNFGSKTSDIVSSIRPIRRELNTDVLDLISPHLKEEIDKITATSPNYSLEL